MESFHSDWSVTVETIGKGGMIHYREGSNSLSTDWEFGAGKTLAIIFFPRRMTWDRDHPWATGRMDEIWTRIAQEVIRQKAPGCESHFDERDGNIYISESHNAA